MSRHETPQRRWWQWSAPETSPRPLVLPVVPVRPVWDCECCHPPSDPAEMDRVMKETAAHHQALDQFDAYDQSFRRQDVRG